MWSIIYLCRPRADSMGGVYQRISTLAQTIWNCFSVLAHKHTDIMRQMPGRQVEAWRLATTADDESYTPDTNASQ